MRFFTGEGIREVEGLMCSAGMDDIGKWFRTGETIQVTTRFYSLSCELRFFHS